MEGFMYCLSNKAFPELRKVGITFERTIDGVIDSLSNSSVPYRFVCDYKGWFKDVENAKKIVEDYLDKYRIGEHDFYEVPRYIVREAFDHAAKCFFIGFDAPAHPSDP